MHVKIWSNHNGAAKILWYRPQFLLLSLLTRQYGPKCAGLIVINYIRVCTPHHLVVLNVTFLFSFNSRRETYCKYRSCYNYRWDWKKRAAAKTASVAKNEVFDAILHLYLDINAEQNTLSSTYYTTNRNNLLFIL